jgi:hypothetical protein
MGSGRVGKGGKGANRNPGTWEVIALRSIPGLSVKPGYDYHRFKHKLKICLVTHTACKRKPKTEILGENTVHDLEGLGRNPRGVE